LIIIPETVITTPRVPDPAAETEMIGGFADAGFSVLAIALDRNSLEVLRAVDAVKSGNLLPAQEIGRRFGVHVIIIGEAFAETSGQRVEGLVSSSGRVEAWAVRTDESVIIAAKDFHASARDIFPTIAGKAALRRAGGKLGDFMIVRIAKHFNLQPKLRGVPPRVSTSVVKFTAPGLPSTIDFSTILRDFIVQLGTVGVIVAGQDLAALLSNGHAGVIPLPDVVLIGTVEKAEVINLGRVCNALGCVYLNLVNFWVSVAAVETETGKILAVARRQKTRTAWDTVVSLGGITVTLFDKTVLGQLVREALKEIAAEITSAILEYMPEPSYFDITTSKKADRFGAHVDNVSFTIITDIGTLTFLTTEIQSILVKDKNSSIILVNGSEFKGQIRDANLIVSGLGPMPITIPMTRIATIALAIK
jgi:hypothetical protein